MDRAAGDIETVVIETPSGRLAGELSRSLQGVAGAFDSTLHAWLQPPWQRLGAPQQEALGALALFPGPFDMPSATLAMFILAPTRLNSPRICAGSRPCRLHAT